MRVLVCGGRDFSDWDLLRRTLDEVAGLFRDGEGVSEWLPPPDMVIINGGALGADTMATRWAHANCVRCEVYEADWERYGRSAGPRRNARMLREGKPDLVIAFPGGKGIQDMVTQAMIAGIPVRKIAHPVKVFEAIKR